MGEGLERALGVSEVEGGRDQPAHRKQVGDGKEGESRAAGDGRQAQTQPEEQAEAQDDLAPLSALGTLQEG